eukprot:SAG31_NODE_50_length_30520_cov_89.906712_21_plen_447_part_00
MRELTAIAAASSAGQESNATDVSSAIRRRVLLEPISYFYELRVHIYQAKHLLPADDNGKSDPYVVASVAGQERRTTICQATLFPEWYQTIRFEALKLPPRERIDMGICPRLVLQLWDKDEAGIGSRIFRTMKTREDRDDFIGRVELPLDNVGAGRQKRPTWHTVKLQGTNAPAGELLVSLQLLGPLTPKDGGGFVEKLPDLPGVGVEPPLRPEMIPCTVEMLVFSCSGLKPRNIWSPKSPRVCVSMSGVGSTASNGNGNDVSQVYKTQRRCLPSSTSPLYCEKISIPCALPRNSLFCASVGVSVLDDQFGVGAVELGSTMIDLCDYFPWIVQNRCGSNTSKHQNVSEASILYLPNCALFAENDSTWSEACLHVMQVPLLLAAVYCDTHLHCQTSIRLLQRTQQPPPNRLNHHWLPVIHHWLPVAKIRRQPGHGIFSEILILMVMEF